MGAALFSLTVIMAIAAIALSTRSALNTRFGHVVASCGATGELPFVLIALGGLVQPDKANHAAS